jgi:cytochrome c553
VNALAGVRSAALILALAPLLSVAAAKPAPSKAAPPSPAAPCAACHGAQGEGMSAAQVPRIAGQSAEYLKKQLDDYANGTRDNAIMANFAKALSDTQRQELSDHFASLSGPYLPEAAAPSAKQLSRGHQLAYQGDEQRQVQACNSCHGPDGSGVLHSAPYVAGQSASYISSVLKSFQSGSRKNDAGELMRSVARRLNDDDIAAVSAYFAQAGAAHVQSKN